MDRLLLGNYKNFKRVKNLVVILICFHIGVVFSQEENSKEIIREANRFVAMGNQSLIKEGNFPKAEVEYRKAISKNPVDVTAKYNLGNAYYNSQKYEEATQRFTETAKIATTKIDKHKAFHNQGNTFMEQKKYKEAVESYKNALRNNPKDDETRYNLALAKKMLEQQQKEEEQNKDQDNKDNKDNEDNKDNKDQEGGNKEEDKKDQEGDNKEEDKKDQEGKDQKEDKGDKEKEDKENKKDQEGEDQKENKDQGKGEKDEKGEPQQPQQIQGQLSPQQVKSLLEAMNNQEKKVQDKINAKKIQGIKTRTEKDW